MWFYIVFYVFFAYICIVFVILFCFFVYYVFIIFLFLYVLVKPKFQGCAWPRNPNIWSKKKLVRNSLKFNSFRKNQILKYFCSPLGPHRGPMGPHRAPR